MRSLVLSNANSTSLTEDVIRAAITPLRGVTHIDARHTQYAGHAAELVAGLTRADYDAIVVIGGDGTVNEVVSGLLGDPEQRPSPETLPKLAIIPTGSANVFVRALGFPNHPATAARQVAELLAKGTYRRLPVGRVNDRWFCVNVGFGMDAEVIGQMDRLRNHGVPATPWHYAWLANRVWRKLKATPPQIRFTATESDGTEVSGEVPFVVASNTNPWTYAGPVAVVTNPKHAIEDGCSLYAMDDISGLGGFLAVMTAMGIPEIPVLRKLTSVRETRVDDATSITLTSDYPLNWQVDGEYEGEETELRLRIFPEALDVVCPNPGAI